MHLSSEYVGAVSRPLEITVTPRQCMNYAAAIGDDNPRYLDDTRENGIMAPPMLAVALTWPLSRDFTTYWEGTHFPQEAMQRQVHHSESLEWRSSILPGMTLHIQGKIAAMAPHRSGTRVLMEYTARDSAGDPVFIEHIGGLLRGVNCTDGGRGEDHLPTDPDGPLPESPAWSRVISLSPLAAHVYDGCADIHFPIHTSPAFAAFVGLPGILYQGTATLAQAVRAITAEEADNDPSRILQAACRFTGMVLPGTDLTVEMLCVVPHGTGKACHFRVRNSQGKFALNSGCVIVS